MNRRRSRHRGSTAQGQPPAPDGTGTAPRSGSGTCASDPCRPRRRFYRALVAFANTGACEVWPQSSGSVRAGHLVTTRSASPPAPSFALAVSEHLWFRPEVMRSPLSKQRHGAVGGNDHDLRAHGRQTRERRESEGAGPVLHGLVAIRIRRHRDSQRSAIFVPAASQLTSFGEHPERWRRRPQIVRGG